MNQRGFTYPELLVVIAVLSILSAMASLGAAAILNGQAIRDLDVACRMLESDLRWMQQLSVNATNTTLPDIQFNNAVPFGYTISINTVVQKSVDFPNTVRLNNPPNGFSFNINGFKQPTETIGLKTFGLQPEQLRYIKIDIAGRVRIDTQP